MTTPTRPATDIDGYIAGFPEDIREILETIRRTIHAAAPDATEAIRYGLPTFVLGKNLAHFGGFKQHIGFYPTPSGIEAFAGELTVFATAKGSIRFPLTEPIPYDLIRRMVIFRAGEIRRQAAGKTRKGAK
jgi:uncharacterized protein YdhG (YjbR/CyaY superfamily)